MKYLGVFEDELPGLVDGAMQSGVFIQKLSSPIYDRYELWHLGWLLKERKLRRIYDDKHGLITCFHSSTRDDWISATTLFSKYSPNRSFTKVCGTLQEAIDLVLENFFRHTVYAEIPSDPSKYWEPCVYNNKASFNYRIGSRYYSGYLRHTGKVYAADALGKSVIKGERMTLKEVAEYFRTLERLGK